MLTKFLVNPDTDLPFDDQIADHDLRPSINLNYQELQITQNSSVSLGWIYQNTSLCAEAEFRIDAYRYSDVKNAVSESGLQVYDHFESTGGGIFTIRGTYLGGSAGKPDFYFKFFIDDLTSRHLYSLVLTGISHSS